MSSTSDALRLMMESLAHAWRTGQWDELARFFHPAVVFLAPTASPMRRGRDACVARYQGFSRQAIIQEHTSAWPFVQAVETTALTATPFTMTYGYEGARARKPRTDVMAWIKQVERWLVIWRMLFAYLNRRGEQEAGRAD